MGSEVFMALKKALAAEGHNTNVGDEGGFAPNLASADAALAFIARACELAGYTPGLDVTFALDPAASEFFRDGKYVLAGEGRTLDAEGLVATSRSSPAATRSSRSRTAAPRTTGRAGRLLTDSLGSRLRLVGDDIFVTNPDRLRRGIEAGVANAILIKLNQIGTLSETLETMEIAHRAGYATVVSHRSGETEDTTVADLAVATNCGQIKTGSLARSERVGKYNQLVRIEQLLGPAARYAGRTVLKAEPRLS